MLKKMRSSVARLGLLALTLCVLPGCSWLPDFSPSISNRKQARPRHRSPVYLRMSPTAPPAPQPEMVPEISDVRNEIWRPGYWSYGNGQFSWVPGSVITKPSFTAAWSPDHWEKREYGWVFVSGYWQ